MPRGPSQIDDGRQWVRYNFQSSCVLLTSLLCSQKYSRYLLVQEELSARATPDPSPKDGSSRKGREGRAPRASAEALAHKRRSTMNSRDAAYDEAEQLRMAIEESKREGGAPSISTGSRRNKRSRSESEE